LNGNTRPPRESGVDDDQLVLIYASEATGGWQASRAKASLQVSSNQKGIADMADISIVQEHGLAPHMARAAAQQVADKIANEYGLACRWEGEVLRFERSGVQGSLTLEATRAALRIQLGFLMGAFASTIEAKVAESMRKVFAA
jgi:putative polyhydroxyalkanoate system protein